MGLIEIYEREVRKDIIKGEQLSFPFLLALDDGLIPAFFTYNSNEFSTWGKSDCYTFDGVNTLYTCEIIPEPRIVSYELDDSFLPDNGIGLPLTVHRQTFAEPDGYDAAKQAYYTAVNRYLTEGICNDTIREAFIQLIPKEICSVYAAFDCIYASESVQSSNTQTASEDNRIEGSTVSCSDTAH